MFETPDWSDDEAPKKSKKPSSIPRVIITRPSDDSMTSANSNKKKKKKNKKKKDQESGKKSELVSQIRKQVDRVLHSPTLTDDLISSTPSHQLKRKTSTSQDEQESSKRKKLKKSVSSSLTNLTGTVSESASQVGSLLRKGIHFSSDNEFFQFLSGKKKTKNDGVTNGEVSKSETKVDGESKRKKKKKKNKKGKPNADADDSKIENMDETKTGDESSKKKRKKKTDEGSQSESFSSQEKSRRPKFDKEKLRQIFGAEFGTPEASVKSFNPADEAKNRLKSSQFRYINELLYSQNGAQSLKMFSSDNASFTIYHQGYTEQLRKWPKDPLSIIINAIMKVSGNPVVADFGCGEARLARSISSCCKKVYSFDLIAANELVTACDMAHTPLEPKSVDIAVFCLSLMGTNLRDFVKEANRVLKIGGTLKIAEVESRFQDLPVDEFVSAVERCGFKLNWKDLSNKYFYLMDFNKVSDCKKKVPEFSLKPCLYKKR